VLPLQQPLEQEVASQAHWPVVLLHSCPDAHGPQLLPPAPQEPLDSEAYASHVPVVPPLQQPLGHEVASQTHWPLPLHSWPKAHALHATPDAPHDELDSLETGSHAPALQQPAQDAPPHVHAPPEHDSPVAHAPQAAPSMPHCELDWVE